MGANLCATRGEITNDSKAGEVPCFLVGESRLPWQPTGVAEEFALFQSKVVCAQLLLREHNRLA